MAVEIPSPPLPNVFTQPQILSVIECEVEVPVAFSVTPVTAYNSKDPVLGFMAFYTVCTTTRSDLVKDVKPLNQHP